MSNQLQVNLTILNIFRKFSKMLARMHHIARKETGPLTKDNNRLMILAKTGLKMVRQIQNNKSLAKWVTSFQKVIQFCKNDW